ncbi:MAG TPA: type II CRISPR RNA-guided endonuclease Cas9 [Bacteroidia bacterium]|nr:type II CRISPR RNA-guided endonuclease Cas9 [Bacteroidia bacterium]HMU19401.1 type II CRISPR RNA-guided endonuclease Cas9 [Bacteroidia bacterium]
MKKILGLDLGTNSIGWALIDNEQKKILGMGSRIIPMGTDKQDYEKGVGITKNADRRTKRTIRKMNKRYKLRRNKLLYILHELGMLPEQFQLNNGIPEANKIQDLELLPIKKGTLQLDSLAHYTLRAKAINENVELKELGKILYSFNQLRGYAGGNSDDDSKKKKEEDNDENESIKKYEVFNQKVTIIKVKQSETKFQGRGKNKGQEFNKFDITVSFDDVELEGETELQNLKEKEGQEEELEIRIRRNKKGETKSVVFALPQKTNWRKQMEKTEEDLNQGNLYISQLILRDLKEIKWTKIRNRVFLRNRYQAEFDAVWETQSKKHDILENCSQTTIEKIANYLFPGTSESQQKLRNEAINGGLKHLIRNQVIYYQRPLKPQTELISKCQFEKDEQVLANSHPLFQEFRCWDQINRMYITSKQEVWNEKKKKTVFQYTDRFLTNDEKQKIYEKLQTQKQLGFGEVAKIVNLKNDKTGYLNGLNTKAKLKGCDTQIAIKKILGENFETLFQHDNEIVLKIWKAIFDNANNGNEYDPNSLKVSSIKDILKTLKDEAATEVSLKFAQTIKFPRKYASLSAKAINNILPLMQLNQPNVSDEIKTKFENIKNLVETGEIVNDIDNNLEDYVISFVQNNPKAIETGGLMYAFASSLVYGKHTAEKIIAQIKNYHDIKYENRNLRNPIVEQISNETMQVVKAIWKQYQFKPEELEIRVELARDLKNSAAERDKIWKGQRKNEDTNKKIKDTLQSEGIPITDRNVLKYKLYVQQNFISPYTQNKIIPLSTLFDDKLYDIDHIIPKSRYFDDSISNKVVCETNINEEKSNRTAWEYISQQNSKFEIRSVDNYIKHINDIFYGKKKKNLLLEKIPTNPVERQLKNTQYITVSVKNELAKVVGSDNVKTSTGEVTDFLRSRWGLKKLFMELTESRFKQMELWDLDENGNPKSEWIKRYVDEHGKNKYEIKNWSKRYDHRHHAIDALVVALTEQSHIQRLNNLNKYLQDELTNRKEEFKLEVKEDENILEAFFNLEEKRREEIQKQIESSRYFEQPFEDLVKQAKAHLEAMTVSIKPKDKLGIKTDEKGNKQLKIRGALHQETYYGKLNGKDTKIIDISKLSAKDISKIIDDVLKKEIDEHRKKYDSMKEAFTGEGLKAFNENRFQRKKPTELKPPVYKVKVWYSTKEDEESTLQRLYDKNKKLSVVTGDNYLFMVMEKNRKRIFDIASLYDSADIAKRALKEKDENYKQRICEDFRVKHKDKPDKVLFTLQQNDLVYLPENVEDQVLNKNDEEFKTWLNIIENKKKFSKRIYKVVKFAGKDCFFIPNNYANVISVSKDLTEEQKEALKKQYADKKIPKKELNFVEYGSYQNCSPYEAGENFVKSLNETDKKKKKELKLIKIQETCIKLKIDWLGNISKA